MFIWTERPEANCNPLGSWAHCRGRLVASARMSGFGQTFLLVCGDVGQPGGAVFAAAQTILRGRLNAGTDRVPRPPVEEGGPRAFSHRLCGLLVADGLYTRVSEGLGGIRQPHELAVDGVVAVGAE